MTAVFGELAVEDSILDSHIHVDDDWAGTLRFRNSIFDIGGTISVDGTLQATGTLNFEPQLGGMFGSIFVGSCAGLIAVTGNMDGDIWLGHFQSTGKVTVSGTYKGDFCDASLPPGSLLPSKVWIDCGIGHDGTICGQEPVCPAGNILSNLAQPPHGTKDARQPYPMGDEGTAVPLASRQGIGSSTEKITMTLSNAGLRALSHDCWVLCETGTEPVDTGTPALSPNKISCISESTLGGSSEYKIELDRPISAKQWTTIRYVPGASRVIYASLPGNISGDTWTNSNDLIRSIDCVNGNTSQCGTTIWTQDLDHNGGFDLPRDYLLTFQALWFGQNNNLIAWQQKKLPVNTCVGGGGGGGGVDCPDSNCGEDPGPMMMAMGGMSGEGGEEGSGEESSGEEMLELLEEEPTLAEQNAVFADWTANFLATADPDGTEAQDIFEASAEMVTQWCVEFFTVEEKAALVESLSDPLLNFASQAGQDAAANVVQALTP